MFLTLYGFCGEFPVLELILKGVEVLKLIFVFSKCERGVFIICILECVSCYSLSIFVLWREKKKVMHGFFVII